MENESEGNNSELENWAIESSVHEVESLTHTGQTVKYYNTNEPKAKIEGAKWLWDKLERELAQLLSDGELSQLQHMGAEKLLNKAWQLCNWKNIKNFDL